MGQLNTFFKKNRLLSVFILVAISSDFIANDLPLYAYAEGKNQFPIAHQLGYELGLLSTNTYTDWREKSQTTTVVFPPIPYTANTLDIENTNKTPFEAQTLQSWRYRHWLGTYTSGKDVLAGLIHSLRKTLLIGILAAFFAGFIGFVIGGIAGYWSNDKLKIGKFTLPIDTILMRLVEVFDALPKLLLLLAFIASFKNTSLVQLAFLIGCITWIRIAQLLRGELLRIRQLPYIESAVSIGLSPARVLFRHALPNVIAPLSIGLLFTMISAISAEATLSFLGIGLNNETITLGFMLHEATTNLQLWWLFLFSSLVLLGLLWSINHLMNGQKK